jgi:hypothetical protein
MSEPIYDVVGVFVPKTNTTPNAVSAKPLPETLRVGELATNTASGSLFIRLESPSVVDVVLQKASNDLPGTGFVPSAGVSEKWSRADHIHPSDPGKVSISSIGVAGGVCDLGSDGKIPSSRLTSDPAKVSTSSVGVAGGVCELDGGGKVPSTRLPSYVDDILEFNGTSNFPQVGSTPGPETGKIYVDTSTNFTYRWTGSTYVQIASAGNGGGAPSGAASGDLSGFYPSPTVSKIQGNSFSIQNPTDGQVLKYDYATQTWKNQADATGSTSLGAAGGDLTGNLPNPTIAKLQGKTISISNLTDGQVLKFNYSTQTWYNGTDNSGTSSGGGISTLTGDISASGTGTVNSTVVGIYGQLISSSLLPNQSGQGLIWNANTSRYERQAIVVESDTITGGTY